MLPKKNRLTKGEDFDLVKREGETIKGKNLLLKYLNLKSKNKKLTQRDSKIGIVVSTRVSKKATDRNRVKRQVRNSLFNILDKMQSGYKIVLLTRRSLLELSSSEIEKEVKNLFKKAGIVL